MDLVSWGCSGSSELLVWKSKYIWRPVQNSAGHSLWRPPALQVQFSVAFFWRGVCCSCSPVTELQHGLKKTPVTVYENSDQIVFRGESAHQESAWATFCLELDILSSLSFKLNFQGIIKSWELFLVKYFVKEMENILVRGKYGEGSLQWGGKQSKQKEGSFLNGKAFASAILIWVS